MDQFLDKIFILADAPVALFLTLFFSSIGNTFFPPIPIELGTIFGGYIVSEGHGSLAVIIVSTVMGMSLGGIILYEIAHRYGSHYFDKKFFSKLMPESLYEKTTLLVHRYGVWSFFLSKFIPGMNFCTIVCAGLFKLPPLRTYAGIIASNAVIFALLAYMGKLAGDHWRSVFNVFGKTTAAAAITVIVIAVAAYKYQAYRNRRKIIIDAPGIDTK
ncbi:MAG: DedA family protein [Elusimicrobiota bacterium]